MKKKITLMLSCLLFLSMQIVTAQRQITGTVTSSEDGGSLPGVSVIEKGTSNGVITDMNGNYKISVSEGKVTLVFSFVGMATKEVVTEKSTELNVVLEPEDVGLDEVVVTALGISREKKALGYAAATVGSEEFERNSTDDPMSALKGKVAGVAISSGGGMPGASTKVIIRGYTSISGGNNPLYVVDGVPINNGMRTGTDGLDFGNRANDINPNDIESVTVLKGAAATAQYGPRGSNGVVMITTKKGKSQEGLTVEYNTAVTVSDILRTPTMQNTFGQGWSGHWADDENGSWGPKMDGKIRAWGNVVDNKQKIKPFSPAEKNFYEFYDFGKQFTNSISLSGGDAKTTFYTSYSNATADGIIPTDVDRNVKHTFRFNGSRKGKIVEANASMNYIRRDGKLTPDGWGGSNAAANLFSELLQIPRDFSIVDFEDYKDDPFNTLGEFYTPYAFNPYYAVNENQAKFYENRVYGNLSLDFKITDWLTAKYRIGADASSFNQKQWEAIMRFPPGSTNDIKSVTENPGMVSDENRTTTQINNDFFITADKTFGDIGVRGMLGFQTYQEEYKRVTGTANSLVIPEFYDISNTDIEKIAETYIREKRTYAYLGEVNFSYKNFAYLNITGRQEYSSTLPKDNNSFFYPSASLSLLLNEVVPGLNRYAQLAKLRVSWGQAGNDAAPYLIDPIFYSTSVWIPFSQLLFPMNGVGAFEKGNVIGNPNLEPEITTEKEVGVELSLLNNRIAVDFSYYNRVSDGQILQNDIAPSSGFLEQVINFGEVENKGIELLATVVPVRTKDLEWSVTANFTKNKNEVLDLPGDETEIQIQRAYSVEMVAIEGKPIGVLRAPDYQRDDEGHIIVNASNGLPEATSEFTEIGNIQPDYILGLSSAVSYKGLSFAITLDIRQGGYMYSGTKDLHTFVGNAPYTTYNERQPFIIPNSVKENPLYTEGSDVPQYIENDVPVTMTNINAYYYHSQNDVANRDRVIDRSYVKLRDISIAYDIPKKFIDFGRVKLKGLQVVLSGRNLLLWTPDGNTVVDPESTSFGNDLTSEFGEFRTGPTVRSFNASLRIKL